MNLGPSGYEPDELPACSNPARVRWAGLLDSKKLRAIQAVVAEWTRVTEDVGAINEGSRQAEKSGLPPRHSAGSRLS